jgi:hypothetical protein
MTEEQHIQKGFNSGYLIAKHKPELSQKLQVGFANKENPYAIGFTAGVKECERELFKSRGKNYTIPNAPNNPKLKSKEKGRDKDNRDR